MPFKTLSQTFELLSGSGFLLSNEQKAVVDFSLPLKKTEANLAELWLWGKLIALDGRDYLIAKGTTEPPCVFEGKLQVDEKIYYSQDGVNWLDLAPIDDEMAQRASTLTGFLEGNPGYIYIVEEPAPEPEPSDEPEPPPKPAEEEEEAPEGDAEEAEEPPPPEPLRFEITESARIRFMVEVISFSTNVIPKGFYSITSKNELAPNVLFSGLQYPDKLESYIHGGLGAPLSEDVQGSWTIQYDTFRGIATLRSLMFPGYVFVFKSDTNEFDALYFGTGEANKDMMFMLA